MAAITESWLKNSQQSHGSWISLGRHSSDLLVAAAPSVVDGFASSEREAGLLAANVFGDGDFTSPLAACSVSTF
jgi:hypothetical protein